LQVSFNCTATPLLFHALFATTGTFISSQDELPSSMLMKVCVLWYQSRCLNYLQIAGNFKYVAAKIWLQRRKEMNAAHWWIQLT